MAVTVGQVALRENSQTLEWSKEPKYEPKF